MYPPHQESIVLICYLSIDLFCCFSNLTPIHIIKSKQFSTEMNKITTSRNCGFSIILVLHESVIFKWFSESNILFQVWKWTLFLVVMWVSPHHFFCLLTRPTVSSPFGNLSSNFYQAPTTSPPHRQSPWLTKDSPPLSWSSVSPQSEAAQFYHLFMPLYSSLLLMLPTHFRMLRQLCRLSPSCCIKSWK